MPSMKILLIAGGWSSEREVSLTGARGMQEALLKRGHAVTFFDLLENFDELLETARQHDFALINLHGSPGEDGLVQAMLEKAGCPYQGSGPSGSFLALNKAAAKQIFRMAGLPTADWEFLPVRPAEGWEPRLPWPLFVKTTTGGSSLRLGRATNRQELDALMDEIFAAGEGVLIAAEILHQAQHGCNSFVILQPFGCLPNHVVGRGIVKQLKARYPDANILPLDYDPDVSFANIENRLQMLIMNAKAQHQPTQNVESIGAEDQE